MMEIEIERTVQSKWRFFLGFLGWVVGLVSLGFTIYGIYKKDVPNLEYEIISTTNFINDNETAANLKIFIDTVDVQQNHLNISAYTIKVQNNGTENLRYDGYDKGLFGLNVFGGTLLEPPTILEASSNHITRQYQKVDSVENNKFVNIPNLTLDIGDYYVLRIVLLHNANLAPSFEPEGKVIGQKTISINKAQPQSPDFWDVALDGNWKVQLVRSIVYIFFIPVIAFLLIVPVGLVSNWIDRNKRKRIIRKIRNNSKLTQFVIKEYIDDGQWAIENPHEIYKEGEEAVTKQYEEYREYLKSPAIHDKKNRETIYQRQNWLDRIDVMIEKGYLIREKGNILFNTDAQKSIDTIYEYLKENHYLRYNHREMEEEIRLREHLGRKDRK